MTNKLCLYAEIILNDEQDIDEEVEDLCSFIADPIYYKKVNVQIDSRRNDSHQHTFFCNEKSALPSKEVPMFHDSPSVKGHTAAITFDRFLGILPKLFFKVVGKNEASIPAPSKPKAKKVLPSQKEEAKEEKKKATKEDKKEDKKEVKIWKTDEKKEDKKEDKKPLLIAPYRSPQSPTL